MRKLQRFCLLAMAVLLLFTAEPASAAKEPEVKASQNTAAKKKKANKWKTKKGKKYYYGADGELAKGLTVIKGKTYFFSLNKGVMQTGWKTVNGKKYYFAESGTSKGVMQNSGFLKINGNYYYFNSDGTVQTGWKTIAGRGVYYFAESGTSKGILQTGLRTINGNIYYFAESGAARGVMQNSGFLKINGNYYYFNSDGTAQTGWKTIEGRGVYYFAESGASKGILQTGLQTIDGKTYYFGESGAARGVMQTGWKTINGKKYYFIESGDSKGTAQTGWIKSGVYYYYFNEAGDMDPNKTVDNKRSGDATGTALQKTERRAEAIVSQITTPTMTKEQKLKVCFDFVMKYTGRRPRTPHYCGNDWPVVYANDMFIDGSGNCFSYAAAFAFLAKACGYEEVYACNSTGHGWTEINGLIYDPEEYRNTKYKYYGTSYSRVPSYRNAISDYNSPGRGFKHVKI